MAFLAMVAIGTGGLAVIAVVMGASASLTEMGYWQLFGAYAVILIVGDRASVVAARALARGDGVLVGSLFGVVCLALGGLAGCLANLLVLLADDIPDWSVWEDFGEPLARLMLIGLLPAVCVGGVFTAVLGNWIPSRRRPPGP